MTAMGIIGIILASAVSLCWLMGGAASLLEERFKLKSEFYARVCEDPAEEAFAKQNRRSFRNTMDDTESIPSEEDEEP